jgi:beta-glucosidase
MSVSFNVRNTGSVAGATVAQIYVGEESPSVPRPSYELKGFQKVPLQPGETRTVTVNLDSRSFAFWSEAKKDWDIDSGRFVIYAGDSSAHLPLQTIVTLR